MMAIAHIRRGIFAISQAEMARIAGVSQATISRWEKGSMSPSLKELEKIRLEAKRRHLEWDDSIIFAFGSPSSEAAEALS